MAEPFESRTITVRIARPQHEVYDFASVPENFPRWASGLARSLKKVNGEWIADTPEGRVKVRFTEPNDFGILDHHIALRPGVEIYIPMASSPTAPAARCYSPCSDSPTRPTRHSRETPNGGSET